MSAELDLDAIRVRVENRLSADDLRELHEIWSSEVLEFLLQVRTDIPLLLDEVERLRGLCRELVKYVESCMDTDPGFPLDPKWEGVRTVIEDTP